MKGYTENCPRMDSDELKTGGVGEIAWQSIRTLDEYKKAGPFGPDFYRI